MKSVVVPALLAVAFAAAGFVFWTLGKTEARLAEAHRQLVMLHYADAAADSDATMAETPRVQRGGGFGKDDQTDAKRLRATADYWQQQYAALEPKRDTSGSLTETDPDALLNGANASFRASQSDADRNATLRRLDAVVKSYGDALKSNG